MMSTLPPPDLFRHPWFTEPSLKRKHSDSSDEDLARDPDSDKDAAPSFYPTPPPESAGYVDSDGEFVERKRRRCDTIERRMARMYIDTQRADQMNAGIAYNYGLYAPPMSGAQSTASDASYTYTAGSTSPVSRTSLLPQYAVEEPVSPELEKHITLTGPLEQMDEPDIAEVRMKGAEPAWYEREKDRIVITDLEEAIEEAEADEYKSEAEPHPDAAEYADSNADFSIANVLLSHIKRQANFPFVPKSETKQNGGALVLFKPLPIPGFDPDESAQRDEDSEDAGVRIEEIDENEARTFSPSGSFTVGTVTMDQEEDEPMDMDVDIEM